MNLLYSADLAAANLDECLRALSHPDRRRFVAECQASQCSAGDLAGMSALALATVSEHLKVLRKSGLLLVEKSGRFWLYRADPDRLKRVLTALNELTERQAPDGT